MGPAEATRSVLRQYATFRGRARRSEYWWWGLVTLLLEIVALVVDEANGGGEAAQLILICVIFLPSLAVTVRRLHDSDRRGWWVLLGIPCFGIVLLVLCCIDSTQGMNRYGPSPKYGMPPGFGVDPMPPAT